MFLNNSNQNSKHLLCLGLYVKYHLNLIVEENLHRTSKLPIKMLQGFDYQKPINYLD